MANAQFNTAVHAALNADDPTRLFPHLPSVDIHLALPYPEPPSATTTTTTSPSQPLTPRALQILRNILETAIQKTAIRTVPHLLTAYSAHHADPPSLATSTHLLAALSLPPKSPLALAFLQLLHAHCPALVRHRTLQQLPGRRNVMPHDGGTLLCYAAMERRADVVAWLVREEGGEVARGARFWGKGVGEWVCAGLSLGDGGGEGEDVDVDMDAEGDMVEEGEVAVFESLAEVRRPSLGPRDGVGMFDRGVARVLLAAGVEFGEYEALVERLVGMGEEEWRAWVRKRRAAVAREERWEGDRGRRNESGMRPLEREREVIDGDGWARRGEFKWFVSTASREEEIWKNKPEDDDDVPLAVLVARWRSVRDQGGPKATSGIADAGNASGADAKGGSGAGAKDNRGANAKSANLPIYKGGYGAHIRDSKRPAKGG